LHDLDHPCARSNGWEKLVMWPANFCCVNRIVKILLLSGDLFLLMTFVIIFCNTYVLSFYDAKPIV